MDDSYYLLILNCIYQVKICSKNFYKKSHLTLSICNTLVYNNVDLKNTKTMDEEEIIMSYTEEVYERVVAQNPNEPEFHQAVKEVLDSLKVVIDKNEEEYRKLSILERLSWTREKSSLSAFRG